MSVSFVMGGYLIILAGLWAASELIIRAVKKRNAGGDLPFRDNRAYLPGKFSADDIQVLEGIDIIRARPTMFGLTQEQADAVTEEQAQELLKKMRDTWGK